MSDPGAEREMISDAIAGAGSAPAPEVRLPRPIDGRIETELTTLAWHARMRWLDDGGR